LTETLTESFCERCGTRYEFSAPTRLNPVRKTRGFIGGLKNYLTSQDSLGDAFDDAMRNEAGALATAQLDAFHEAFNFCIDCRQYTCVSCWNDAAGRCRSCVPVPGVDDLSGRLAASVAGADAVSGADMTEDDLRRRVGLDAWPTSDLPEEAAANGHVSDDSWATTPGAWTNAPAASTFDAEDEAAPAAGGFVGADGFVYETQEQADAVAANMRAEAEAAEAAARAVEELEAQQAAEAAAEAALAAMAAEEAAAAAETSDEADATWVAGGVDETPAAAEAPAEPAQAVETEAVTAEAQPVTAEAEPVTAEAEPEPTPLRVVAWDEDAAPEVIAEEPIVAEAEVEPEAEPEPIAGSAAPEAEPEAPSPTAPRLAPISETILHFPPRSVEADATAPLAAQDETPEAAARRAQLDELGLDGGPTQPEMPDVLPYRSRGATVSPAELAMRAAAGQRFWEASAREVASATANVGVQNCGHCGLSLSASARFCRRCGTRQAA
jgi:hypothetical protein